MDSEGALAMSSSKMLLCAHKDVENEEATAAASFDVECRTPTPHILSNLNSSEKYDSSEAKYSSAVLGYDSGNYSTSSNASEVGCAFETDLRHHCQNFHFLLRERDQALFLAMQDVRKLRSELERLNKSEEWYKKELRAQKSTRLDTLERLYAQERKYMQENQRLQRECMRLYDKCSEMEKELQMQREKSVEQMAEDVEEQRHGMNKTGLEGDTFELGQQRATIDGQQNLINVLRKQKSALLGDLKRLNEEKDAKVIELQQTLAGVEVENMHITAQFKRMLAERSTLEKTLLSKDAVLNAENVEKMKMQVLIDELKEQCSGQQQALTVKEHEIHELQQQFTHDLTRETNMDEVHRLSVAYHEEINVKTAEITSLKKSLHALQIELRSLTDLQRQNEQQERQIEQLNFALQTRQCELNNLQETDEKKTNQITELQQNFEKFRIQHENTLEKLCTAQATLKCVEQELISLHEKYANMCALCERTRFELELLEIEQGKLKFQADNDKREIAQLRERLKGYLKHVECLGERISELEEKLKRSIIEKKELQASLDELEQRSISGIVMYTTEAENHKYKQEIGSTQNRSVTDQLEADNEALETNEDDDYEECIKEALGMERYVEDDSGFLDGTKDDADNENLPVTLQFPLESQNVLTTVVIPREMANSQTLRDSVCSALTAEYNRLHEHLNTQSVILDERHTVLTSIEKLIGGDVQATTAKTDFNINNDQETEMFQEPNSGTSSQFDSDELSQRQELLMAHLNDQTVLTVEKKQVLEAFETLINEVVKPQETSNVSQFILEMKNLTEENKILKTKITAAEELFEAHTLRQKLAEKSKKCEELDECLKKQSDAMQILRKKLLQNDGELFKIRRDQDQVNNKQFENYIETINQLQQDNTRLRDELQTLMTAKCRIEDTLQQQRDLVEQLKTKLVAHESIEINIVNSLLPTEMQELLSLRAKVQQLEECLQTAQRDDEASRDERIRLINKLLEQQNSKVEQLTESQAEWEEVLATLHATQKLQENTSAELELKHHELEELNALFAEQNEELRLLQENAILSHDTGSQAQVDELRALFQQQVEDMEASFNAQLMDAALKRGTDVEELQRENGRLERIVNEDFAKEVTTNQKQLLTLQAKVEKLQAERNAYAQQLSEMNIELQQLKKSKRNALMLPSDFVVFRGTDKISVCDAKTNSNTNDAETNDRLRILTKVLEAEYNRKMKRYDLHIHTLLGNIKGLKKALRAAEQRAAHSAGEQGRTEEEVHELQLTRRHLEEMRLKCDQSQATIKALEQALETERKKFEASDLGKATKPHDPAAMQRNEPAHEVANLIDDYKKLIKQSALATCRPKTSVILELIQHSNQCVPNLHTLETTIDGLRNDLERFLSAQALRLRHPQSVHKFDVPSLMDELRAATENY